MSTSGSIIDSLSSSDASETEASEIADYELEVEEFESLSDGGTQSEAGKVSSSVSLPVPYDDEPIADEEWANKYNEKKEKESTLKQALQDRLDNHLSIEDWCECKNCRLDVVGNIYELQCCQEIKRCVQSMNSAEVLEDVEMPPSCITNHPGFYSNCLDKWTLRLAASNYKRRDRRKYRQSGSENAFLRSVAYRQFTRLVYGKLGKLRIPLPSCVYHAIRTQFKSEKTTGFEENSSDSE